MIVAQHHPDLTVLARATSVSCLVSSQLLSHGRHWATICCEIWNKQSRGLDVGLSSGSALRTLYSRTLLVWWDDKCISASVIRSSPHDHRSRCVKVQKDAHHDLHIVHTGLLLGYVIGSDRQRPITPGGK